MVQQQWCNSNGAKRARPCLNTCFGQFSAELGAFGWSQVLVNCMSRVLAKLRAVGPRPKAPTSA
eukprot:14182432-Alexandrium_andersonii.AAC.1